MGRLFCFIIGLILVLIPCLTEVGHKKEKSEIVYVNENLNKLICENEETYSVPKEKIDSGFYKVGEQYEYDSFSWVGISMIIIGCVFMSFTLGGDAGDMGDVLEGLFSHH